MHRGTIYKRDTGGDVRVWSMEFMEDDDGLGYHRTIAGKLNGKTVVSGWTLCEPKNVGRKNATDSVQQAWAEIKANYTKKLELTYFDKIEDIDSVRYTDPMLALDYTKRSGTFNLQEGVYTQPKLDGIRCIARTDGLYTRKGKKIASCAHLIEALAPFFEKNPEAILDGELYNHLLNDDFNKIASIVRKGKPSVADVSRALQFIEYHVYDWVHENEFGLRAKGVQDAVRFIASDFVKAVPTKFVATQEALDSFYADWIEDGYEGQMVRLPNTPYQCGKRSASLMKRKEFLTDEFRVIRVEEGKGNWAGCVKRFVFAMPNGEKTKSGDDPEAGVRGSQEVLAKLLQSGNTPTWATIRYFTPTPDGIPRFPVVLDWGFGSGRVD